MNNSRSEPVLPGPLLATKLYIPPPRPRRVARPRLIERLNEGLAHRLILVSGPAGFGKTTLLGEWAQEVGPHIAWLTIDQGDNDPTRFWMYAFAALQTLQEDLGAPALAALQTPQPPAMEALIAGLINDVAASGPESLVLVLDDFHLITAQAIHEALLFLVDHLPPAMHLVLATRADPPWPLARLRARGEMTEVRTDDLRFTPPEVAAFLNEVMALRLSATEITALDERTEGWIAGLQMAALSLQGRGDTAAFIQDLSGSHRFILDYLVEEVLDRLDAGVQEFLRQTAVLDRLTAPLCDAVTARQDSESVLLQLERANLFLVSLDDDRRWYRYHPLFADLLRMRLERVQPGHAALLHRRASRWYEEQQMIVEAMAHAHAAHDGERVAHLVEDDVLRVVEHGNTGALVEWLNALPVDWVRSRPWLSIARAWALAFTGSFDAVTPCLEDALQAAEGRAQPSLEQEATRLTPDAIAHVKGHVDAVRCYVLDVTSGRYSLIVALAESALEQLPERDWRTRGLVTVLLGLAHRLNMNFGAAHDALTKGLVPARAAGQAPVVIDLLCQIARVEADQGRLRDAAATCRAALREADAHGAPGRSRFPVAGYALETLADTLLEWNDLDAALDCAHEALVLARQWGDLDCLLGAYWSLVHVHIARGEFGPALERIRERARLAVVAPRYHWGTVATEAMVRLAMNDLAAASRLVDEMAGSVDKDWLMARAIPVYLAQFRHGLRSSLDDVLDYVARALAIAEAGGARPSVVQVLVWQAAALCELGRTEEARPALTRALALAEPEGYVRTFVDAGAPIAALLGAILADLQIRPGEPARQMRAYIGRLLAALSPLEIAPSEVPRALVHGGPAPAKGPGEAPVTLRIPPLVEPLSAREMEVLRLLATSLSTPEIARELIVSVNTVRSHVRSVYGKLNAHGRMEALERARELGLLP